MGLGTATKPMRTIFVLMAARGKRTKERTFGKNPRQIALIGRECPSRTRGGSSLDRHPRPANRGSQGASGGKRESGRPWITGSRPVMTVGGVARGGAPPATASNDSLVAEHFLHLAGELLDRKSTRLNSSP